MNNYRKPIGTGIATNRQVGATYGERKQLTSSNSSNAAVGREFYRPPRDIVETRPAGKTLDLFQSNTEVMPCNNRAHPHQIIEAGKAHPRSNVTDPMRLKFLDKIIAGLR